MIKRALKYLIYSLLVSFVLLNVITIFHAYKFTHFLENEDSNRTKSPTELSILEKIPLLFFGVNNPKPNFKGEVPTNYSSKKFNSNVELEIWENIIPNSKGTVLIFHGYSSEKSSLLKNAAYFNKLGYSTVLTDFMGCGNSEGNTTTIGFYEAENVKAVYNYAHLKTENVILYGNSMGAVSIMKAISDFNIQPKKVIIECPFGTMSQTVENRFENMNVPTFPMAYMLTFWGVVINGFWAFDHNPQEYAKNISQPILLMYGAKDKNVKTFETENIFKNIKSKDKKLKIFKSAEHENYLNRFCNEWEESISNFVTN
ncbi:alpha/beta hydrolase [Chishuiella changwenlii]|uniref:alpha/beta hydrolase n=1 Tax=Chishuiella changwenlii TaxID=1434701 RepID=UPI002FD8EC2A